MKTAVAGLAALLAILPTALSEHNASHGRQQRLQERDAVVCVTTWQTVYHTAVSVVTETVWVYPDGTPVTSEGAIVAPTAAPRLELALKHKHKHKHTRKPFPTIAPKPSTSPSPSPKPTTTSSAPTATFTGDMTYYAVGLGSCGHYNTDADAVVAVPVGQMNNPANPNTNPLCGRTVSISYGGKTKQATVVDTCMGCADGDLDMAPSLFAYFAPLELGRVPGMTWSYD